MCVYLAKLELFAKTFFLLYNMGMQELLANILWERIIVNHMLTYYLWIRMCVHWLKLDWRVYLLKLHFLIMTPPFLNFIDGYSVPELLARVLWESIIISHILA